MFTLLAVALLGPWVWARLDAELCVTAFDQWASSPWIEPEEAIALETIAATLALPPGWAEAQRAAQRAEAVYGGPLRPWDDPWGRRWVWTGPRPTHSAGINGRDERGGGDDLRLVPRRLALHSALRTWLFTLAGLTSAGYAVSCVAPGRRDLLVAAAVAQGATLALAPATGLAIPAPVRALWGEAALDSLLVPPVLAGAATVCAASFVTALAVRRLQRPERLDGEAKPARPGCEEGCLWLVFHTVAGLINLQVHTGVFWYLVPHG